MKLKDTCSLEESVKVTQSCLTLCNPMGCSLPGSSVHEIPQARILEWVAIPYSRGSSQRRDQTQVSYIAGGFFTSWATREAAEIQLEDGWTPVLQWSPLSTQMRLSVLTRVRLFATQWTVACQAPLSMRFCRQEYWSGLPSLLQGNLPDPGTEPSVS